MVMIRGMKHEVIDRRLILKVFRGEFIPCVKLLKRATVSDCTLQLATSNCTSKIFRRTRGKAKSFNGNMNLYSRANSVI
jgi:hypothetical protein